MTLNLEAIKARCKTALCPECDGRGSVPDRPGYSVLCICADGLSEDGEDMPVGQFVRDLRDAVAEVERLRKVESAARDMLNFGAHDGPCSHEEEGGKCLLHVVTSKTRERALRAALNAAQGGG